MSDDDIIKRASRFFPTLNKDLDSLSLSELVRDSAEYDAMSSEIKNEREAELIDNAIYSRLEKKVLDTISPVLNRYKLLYYKEGRRRWLSLEPQSQFKIKLLILGEGFELQPKYVLAPNDDIGIFFPERPNDRPREYKSYVNLLYKSIQEKVYNIIESAIEAIAIAKSEITKYPKDSLVIDTAKKSAAKQLGRYQLFDKYHVWSYMLGKGFRIGANEVITKDGRVEKAW